MLIRVLVVVDDSALERRLDAILSPLETTMAAAPPRGVFWDRVRAFPADLVVVSRTVLRDPIDRTVAELQALPERPEVIVVRDGEDARERVQLLIAGCTAVLNTALSDDLLRDAFEAFVTRQRQTGIHQLQHQLDVDHPGLDDFASRSPSMASFLRLARRVAASEATILIQGETGVGKERLARAIHAGSGRSSGPFVSVTPAAIPETLLESELFGHTKGAFTGALGTRRGCFELAHSGTILLDEIGDLSQHLQVKLLRVLQERTIQRIGSEKLVDTDVRVIAASHRDLRSEAKAGRFREDLYYRLAVVTLEVPPLRERAEDIPALLDRYFLQFQHRLNARVEGFSQDALDALRSYAWPGNVRELVNVVERAVLLSDGDRITIDDLPRTIVPTHRAERSPSTLDALCRTGWQDRTWTEVRDAAVRACERDYFAEQLTRSKGNLKRTASASGVNPKSLYEIMQRHGLRKDDFKPAGSGTGT